MRDAVVGGEEVGVEGFGCVGAGEGAGFGGGEEDLGACRGVDGEVVDAFVGWGIREGGTVGGLREHGEDGCVVWFG